MPDFSKEDRLSFEKEVLGIYISGHPLENQEKKWRSLITATASDFRIDEEGALPLVEEGKRVTIGGIITEKTIKFTRKNQTMAFVSIEDLLGITEVIVFPKSLETHSQLLNEGAFVFVSGRVSMDADNSAKLILENITNFDDVTKELWLQLENKEAYGSKMPEIASLLRQHPGKSDVVIYLKSEKAMKRLPADAKTEITPELLSALSEKIGEENVRSRYARSALR